MSDIIKTTGSCLCGDVSYEVSGDPMFAAHCCCTDCQKASGADHITLAFYSEDQVQISGDLAEFSVTADSGNTNTRIFCPKCGGRLFSRNSARDGTIGIQVGSMDNPQNIKPAVAVYTKDRREWDVLNEDLNTFETSPPPKG